MLPVFVCLNLLVCTGCNILISETSSHLLLSAGKIRYHESRSCIHIFASRTALAITVVALTAWTSVLTV